MCKYSADRPQSVHFSCSFYKCVCMCIMIKALFDSLVVFMSLISLRLRLKGSSISLLANKRNKKAQTSLILVWTTKAEFHKYQSARSLSVMCSTWFTSTWLFPCFTDPGAVQEQCIGKNSHSQPTLTHEQRQDAPPQPDALFSERLASHDSGGCAELRALRKEAVDEEVAPQVAPNTEERSGFGLHWETGPRCRRRKPAEWVIVVCLFGAVWDSRIASWSKSIKNGRFGVKHGV